MTIVASTALQNIELEVLLLGLSADPTQGYHLHNLSQHQTDTHDGIGADVSELQTPYSGAYNIGMEGF